MTSLRTRLILAFLTVSALGIALGMAFAGITTSGEFRRFVFALNQEDMQSRLTGYYAENGSWEGVETELARGLPPPPETQPRAMRPGMFTLTDEAGRVLIGGPEWEPGQQLTGEQLQGSKPIDVAGATVGWLILSGDSFVPRGGEADFFRRVNTTLLLGAVTAFAVALVAGALAARSLTRPLHDLTEATKAVASGDFERRVEVASRDELAALATSFNQMSDALAESRRLRRQMTADIAHELRTPLSIILGHLDGVDDGVLKDSGAARRVIREETEHLSRLVEDLRTLTLADAGELVLEARQVDVEELVWRVRAAYQPQAAAGEVELSAEVEPGMEPVRADPVRVSQVLGNLLANGILHTPKGGRIVLTAGNTPTGVRLGVRDSGPGFASADLERVFERFYRSDKARRRQDGGSGLGLAIARSIIEAHGGTIEARNAPGGGALIIAELPRMGPRDAAL